MYINEPIAIGYFYFKLSDCTDRLSLNVRPPLNTKKKKYTRTTGKVNVLFMCIIYTHTNESESNFIEKSSSSICCIYVFIKRWDSSAKNLPIHYLLIPFVQSVCGMPSINLTIDCNIYIYIEREFSRICHIYIIELFLFPYLNLCA